MDHEKELWQEAQSWKKKLIRRESVFRRFSKNTQDKITRIIPAKAHAIITESIKQMAELTMTSSEYLSKSIYNSEMTFQQKEELIREKITKYKRMAALEGAGTGAGGILLGLADFPLLLAIKMRLLFEISAIYGQQTNKIEERLFLLTIFQLAFASEAHKERVLGMIEQWGEGEVIDIDWRQWQQDYRDHIDLVKMFQLVPGIGAVVGAYANYHLIDHLGETAIQCFRLRLLKE
jgi:uncharacterized protein (DUF697 family)